MLLHVGAHAVAIVLVGRAALAGQLPLTQVATAVPAILAVGMSYNGFAAVQTKRAATAYRAMRNLPHLIAERHPEHRRHGHHGDLDHHQRRHHVAPPSTTCRARRSASSR